MTRNCNFYHAKIFWKNEYIQKSGIINNSPYFVCNLKFLTNNDIWSVILQPIIMKRNDESVFYNINLMFPENNPISISIGTRFLLLEGPVKVIGEGEVIE